MLLRSFIGQIKSHAIACVSVTGGHKLKISDAALSIGEENYFGPKTKGFCTVVVNTGLSTAHYLEL